jgi:hypothetical protein
MADHPASQLNESFVTPDPTPGIPAIDDSSWELGRSLRIDNFLGGVREE